MTTEDETPLQRVQRTTAELDTAEAELEPLRQAKRAAVLWAVDCRIPKAAIAEAAGIDRSTVYVWITEDGEET